MKKIMASSFVCLLVAFPAASRADGFSGVIDAATTDPKGKSAYLRVMTPKVKVQADSVCRFSIEANVDKPGRLTFGPNLWSTGKPHFYRLCHFNAEPGWRTYSFKVYLPGLKDAPALEGGEVPLFVGIDRSGSIGRLEFRNVKVERLPDPPPPTAISWWSRRGKNGFFNASFELGLAPHAVLCHTDYVIGARGASWSVDETCAKEGRRSLKVDNTAFGKTVELMTAAGGFAAPAGADGVTVSAWVKADRPTKVTMLLRDSAYDFDRHKLFWSGSPTTFDVGTEWTRISMRMKPDAHHAQYIAWLRFSGEVVCWFDALQIENGRKPTDFEPAAPVEAMLTADERVIVKEQPGFWKRLFSREKKHTAVLRAVNYTSTPQHATCRTDCGAAILDIPAKGVAERTLSYVPPRYGAFEYGGEIGCEAGTGRILPFSCAVVGDVPASPPTKDVFFTGFNAASRCVQDGDYPAGWHNGYLSDGSVDIETHFRNLRLAGCRMLRYHDDGTGWWSIERTKGVYDWVTMDTIVDQCLKNGIESLYVFGSGIVTIRNTTRPDTFKDWFVRKNSKIGPCRMQNRECYLPDEGDWRDFYTALVKRYRGKIRYYEVVNEPNGTMPDPKDYFRYLKLSHEIVRANDPEAKVVGVCSTGDYGADTGRFIEEIGNLGGFKYFDILSFHPYAAPIDISAFDAEKQLRDIRALVDRFAPGMPILQDEVYYLSAWDTRRISGAPRDDRGLAYNWPDGNLIRRYAIDLAGGSIGSVSITGSRLMCLSAAQGTYAGDGMNNVPNGLVVAANAFSRFLEGGRFVTKPEVARRFNAFVYLDRRGGEVALAWVRQPEDKPLDLTLPKGMTACDLYGNPLGGRISLGSEPVYFFGKGLNGKLSSALK